ncbi:hypothetical protein RH915_09300 [Serpentinicella sp. ANB-PHB4]|uniref:hypothetical protein n=1 Tax=Serpentinicella sp. ANB-PHB4 TaxID=3074076 RepID=UPI002857F72C|nr:hypothetical protein [Serpentinicella sp. ANB-PHB4]MDR5659690.1 hypothetical protein [Serpentinicella sp. ANB-PHB4]
MKINFKAWGLGGKLIFISTCLAVLSMFMTWADVGFLSASGFQQQGYLFLILYIYPVYKLLKEESINKKIGLSCSIVAVVGSILYLGSKSVEVFGQTVNTAGTGLYLFVLTAILLTIGIFKYEV